MVTTNAPEDLERTLRRIDGRGYKAYADIAGAYDFGDLALFVDYVQGDPFAPPSKVRVRIPLAEADVPGAFVEERVANVAICDYLARQVADRLRKGGGKAGGLGNSGRIYIDAGRQEVLDRSSVKLTGRWVEARMEVGLPAAGRKILGKQAAEILLKRLPGICRSALVGTAGSEEAVRFVQCVQNQEFIREKLDSMGLIAFVADGSILPRTSGVSDRPLAKEKAVPFASPESLRVSFELPHPVDPENGEGRTVAGMGLRKGVTLIAGGGYHGKSTLLRALERCVYPHIPNDGREYVIANPEAVKIRAEDRRRVEKVNVAPFINGLPNGQATEAFCTDEASGSTSQAAAIVESIEAGASALLIDEDTSATNLMVRDARMQALVAKAHEPITPLIDRVRELYDRQGVSTVLVMGGSGDYFEAADQVILMREYRSYDVTGEARRIASENPVSRTNEAASPFEQLVGRRIEAASLDPSHKRKRIRIDAPDIATVRFGEETIDLRAVEQLVDRNQTRAVGYALRLLAERQDGDRTVVELLDEVERLLEEEGMDALDPYLRNDPEERQHPGNFARPRRHEIAAALNRLRSLRVAG